MGDYIQINIPFLSEAQKDLLLAQLNGLGFEGFEEGVSVLMAFIPMDQFSEAPLARLVCSQGLAYSVELIRETNWNEAWEAGFEPVRVGDFCAIRADFHAPVHAVTYEIIITPKMSFGTGHHATTMLMIEAMRRSDLRARSVFDFGTGTGILAILAEKMGASSIVAIDSDEWSIENGKENIKRNACLKTQIYQADALPDSRFDVILANINKNVILASLGSFKEHLSPEGIVIMSGLLTEDLQDLLDALEKEGLQVLSQAEKSGWICLVLARQIS